MKLPNFQEVFFQTFAELHKPIKFRIRSDSNFLHDVQFLNSLILDSSFELKDVITEKRTVTIPLVRSRWELREEVKKQNMLEVPAVLKFSKVKSVRWVIGDIQHRPPFSGTLVDADDSISGATQCQIDTFFVGDSTYLAKSGETEVILKGYPRDWQLRIVLPAEGWSIALADLPAPNEKI
jgi:hypothetical protein